MASSVDTGLGATVTALPGSWTGNTVSIDLGEHSIPTVDISHLGSTTFRELMVGDLADPGSVTLSVQHKGDTALPTIGTTGTLTITDAQATGETAGANWSGTAIVTRVNLGSRGIDELKTAEVEMAWDGATGPTYTAATTA